MVLSALILEGKDRLLNIPEVEAFSDGYSKINYIRRLDRNVFNMVAYAITLVENKE